MIISLLIMAGAGFEFLVSILFCLWLRRKSRTAHAPLPPTEQTATWIIVSVRGADPTLDRCLRGLLEQAYVDYQVCVVVDHPEDSAHALVENVKSSHPAGERLLIRHLENPLSSCSLKCSAVAEATEYLLNEFPETKFIVLVDADVNVHPTMLAEVTGPLLDPLVGVASGCQWFEPPPFASIATHVRSLWNSGAFLLTVFFQNPWAGTFAMRSETIRETGLIDVWRTSAVDDGPIKSVVKAAGKKSVVVPSLIMVNRESCTMAFVQRWMSRILTWSRIHEPTFLTTQFNVVATDLLIIGTLIALIWGIVTASMTTISWTVTALLVSGCFLISAYSFIRATVIQCTNNTKTFAPPSVGRSIKLLLLILPTQWIYSVACWRAMTSKRVHWRGIDYSIDGRKLRMEGYRKYESETSEPSDVSI